MSVYGSFLNVDIVHCVADQITSPYDLFSLHLTNKSFYTEVFSRLYRLLAESKRPNGNPWLIEAVSENWISLIKRLLDVGADISLTDAGAGTALHWAAGHGRPRAVALLLGRGAIVNVQDEEGLTPLHGVSCVEKKSTATLLVRYLLRAGANPNVVNTDGLTPLHGLADQGNIRAVQLLLENGADPSLRDFNQISIIAGPVFGGHVGVLELLLQYGAKPFGEPYLHYGLGEAAKLGKAAEMLRLLQEYGFDIDEDLRTGPALIVFAGKGNKEAIRVFLDHGANINTRTWAGWTTLHEASEKGHDSVVRLLLDRGAETNLNAMSGATPLVEATYKCHENIVKMLLEYGADLLEKDRSGSSPLHAASDRGIVSIVQMLLDSGADINAANDRGETPLDNAFAGGHEDVVSLLQQRGAVAVRFSPNQQRVGVDAELANVTALEEEAG